MPCYKIYNQFPKEGQEFKSTNYVQICGDKLEYLSDETALVYDDNKLVGIIPKGLTIGI